jgi:5-methylcytosine-specific restriction endonuclease McrA
MTANRRARMYGADGQIGYETVLELWRREPACVDCGEGRGVDHVIPFIRGGSNTSGNLANRCRSCNARKGRRLPEEMTA